MKRRRESAGRWWRYSGAFEADGELEGWTIGKLVEEAEGLEDAGECAIVDKIIGAALFVAGARAWWGLELRTAETGARGAKEAKAAAE